MNDIEKEVKEFQKECGDCDLQYFSENEKVENYLRKALQRSYQAGRKDRDKEVLEWIKTKDTRKACNYKGDNYSQGYYTALKMLKTFINKEK